MELRGSFYCMDNDELMGLQRQIDVINAQLGQALGRGDLDGARTFHAQLTDLELRRSELLHRATAEVGLDAPTHHFQASEPHDPPIRPRHAENHDVQTGSGRDGRPLREVVLHYLHLTGRPTSVQLLADLARAVDRYSLPSARVASLRRDEERSFRSSASRSAYVVPALTWDRFTPVRGVLASSAWPLEMRLIAPASPRVDLLQTVLALAHDIVARAGARQAEIASTGQGMELLMRKLVRSIPNALESSHLPLDYGRISQAAAAELAIHEAGDIQDRGAAAERARRQLRDPAALLFGDRPTVITNSGRKEA